MAEVGFVGRAPGKYQVYLGGNESSTRLNKLWKESVKTEELGTELRPLFTRFKTRAQRCGTFRRLGGPRLVQRESADHESSRRKQ